ncbi:phosphoglycolate phosphatase [Zoogloea sp.]|uniref:phosphoglycolate phosphatase n=1 Tax=Zoogloea sp. TaxID=49181 RepID=UPI00261BC2DF|nr:phosphoglycolate phosphatase [Zoogloea sp.]MDD3353487.1 phosphoglycolate phosphatase [Zoogloea sp.]
MAEAVFFDLDGTLADTAPDLANALNRLKAEHGLPPSPCEILRPQVSNGVRGMLASGFGLTPEDSAYPALAARFLALYEEALCVRTQLFQGMDNLLEELDSRGIVWGVVTNKSERLARPIIEALGLQRRCACIVGGDTAARPKPYPDPLLHACDQAGVEAVRSAYVGDDLRDIQAGQAAGMVTIAASYGYQGSGRPIHDWKADHIIKHPTEILALL